MARRRMKTALGGSRAKKGVWEPDPKQLEMFYAICQGKTYREVAAEHGVKSHTNIIEIVRRVKNWLIPQWADDIRGIKAQQTQSLLHIFGEAMKAWEKSKEQAVTVRRKGVSLESDTKAGAISLPAVETTETTVWQCGDPRFLSEARAALREIREIWGANAPIKVEHSGELRVAGETVEEANRQLLERVEQVKARLLQPGDN